MQFYKDMFLVDHMVQKCEVYMLYTLANKQ